MPGSVAGPVSAFQSDLTTTTFRRITAATEEKTMRQVELPDGTTIPCLGLGTWRMGESMARRSAEVAAVRAAIEMGYRLIDSAEMYGEGGAEELVGRAVAESIRTGALARGDLFVVSKVYPHNASRAGLRAACDRSRQRLGLDRIDLYLLHWRGENSLRETVEGMRELVARGAISNWGVSNLDVDDMDELASIEPTGGPGVSQCATNQIYYSLSNRGPEFSLMPWLRRNHMPLMAYSPIDQGALSIDPVLTAIAAPRGLTAAQVALAWLLAQPGVIAIPKAVKTHHLRENLAAAELVLSTSEQELIEARFPAPKAKTPLAMI
jgi:diketogulonate reductase-like aldo/keto reductase